MGRGRFRGSVVAERRSRSRGDEVVVDEWMFGGFEFEVEDHYKVL